MKMFVESIRIDGGTQPRAAINEAVVAEYAEALKDGAKFPPVDVFFDGTEYWLAEGFHRYHGHRKAKIKDIAATVHNGTRRDAVMFSVGANSMHGLRRSVEDKRRAVMTLLEDDEWSRLSDRQIASACQVSHPFVAGLRASLRAPASGNVTASPQVIHSPSGNVTTYPQGEDDRPAAPASAKSAEGGNVTARPAQKKPAKPVAADNLIAENESLREQLAEALENAREMASQFQALVLATDPEHAKKFIEQQTYIATLEAQRDDWQNQCAQLKREVATLRRRLGVAA